MLVPTGPIMAAAMTIGASIHDIRKHEVPDSYWVPWLILAVIQFFTTPSLPMQLLTLAVASSFFLLRWITFLGGADAKALGLITLFFAGHYPIIPYVIMLLSICLALPSLRFRIGVPFMPFLALATLPAALLTPA